MILTRHSIAAVSAVLLLAGCGGMPGNEGTGMTIQQAKAEVTAEYDHVLSVLPAGSVTTKRIETTTLTDCSDGGHSWLGGLYVDLPADAQPEAVIAAIRELYAADAAWGIQDDHPSPSGHAIGVWKGGDGSRYGDSGSLSISIAVLEPSDGSIELSFQPSSRCVDMGADFDPFTEY